MVSLPWQWLWKKLTPSWVLSWGERGQLTLWIWRGVRIATWRSYIFYFHHGGQCLWAVTCIFIATVFGTISSINSSSCFKVVFLYSVLQWKCNPVLMLFLFFQDTVHTIKHYQCLWKWDEWIFKTLFSTEILKIARGSGNLGKEFSVINFPVHP